MKKFLSIFMVAFCLFGITAALAVSFEAQKATFSIYIDGDKFKPDNPAVVIDGTTYLSLVDLADALGVEVNWNDKLSRVEVETNTYEDEDYYYEYYEYEDYDYYYDDEDVYYEEEEDYEEDYYYDDEISLEFCINWLTSYLNGEEEDTTSSSTSTNSSTAKFVGSKSSKKYHTTDCSWAKKISSDNRTYFSTAKQAESAGYTACMTCID